GKKGVVRDKDVHREVILRVMEEARRNAFAVKGLDFSPLKGPEGNIEYLLYLCKGLEDLPQLGPQETNDVVERAHLLLDAKEIP
ncbi:MAG: TlyA family RNA methyltransferase, partial [Oscillospiraceae bacterium]